MPRAVQKAILRKSTSSLGKSATTTKRRVVAASPGRSTTITLSQPHTSSSSYQSQRSGGRGTTTAASPIRRRVNKPHDYEWALYHIKHDPLQERGLKNTHHHTFSKVKSGSSKNVFVSPGTIARDVFTSHVFGELNRRVFDMTDLVVVYDVTDKSVTAFRGYKRLSDKGKYYTAVKTVYDTKYGVSRDQFRSMRWVRSHGVVTQDHSKARV